MGLLSWPTGHHPRVHNALTLSENLKIKYDRARAFWTQSHFFFLKYITMKPTTMSMIMRAVG